MNKGTNNGGIGFTGLLTLLFIGLKLAGIIEWRWLWVLSPLWIGAILLLVAATIIVMAKRGLYGNHKRQNED